MLAYWRQLDMAWHAWRLRCVSINASIVSMYGALRWTMQQVQKVSPAKQASQCLALALLP